jgi:hypothetical protein
MYVRELRITVLKSAGNFTREDVDLSAEKISAAIYFAMARARDFISRVAASDPVCRC